DFGRLGAGKLKLNVEPADLSDLANELRNLWAPQSRRRGLSLMIGLSPDVPSLIKVDTGRVRQIANNLISNALKFTSRGGVTVSIAVHPVAGRTMLSVEVADTGTGIPDKDKTRLFKAFETGAEPGERLPGWGLGLSISNALAKHLDGSLSVADNPAGGAVFTLLVPVEKARPAELVGGERLKSGRFALGEALLIEDHEPSAFIVTDALTTAGWSVVRAKSLSAARKMTGAKRFQVILTDLHLIDGHAGPFVETLRAGSGLNKTQPIAAITADVSGSVEQVCRAQGFDRVIRKPVQGPALVANLADLLMSHAAGKISRPALRGRLAS
ncbi:MAG: ATP-binding protein, partial [Pseudomonadota bacterium]